LISEELRYYSQNQKFRSSACLFGMLPRDDNNRNSSDGGDGAEIEEARKRLEAMLGTGDGEEKETTNTNKVKKLSDYPRVIKQKIIPKLIAELRNSVMDPDATPPTLTSIARERRTLELTLLSSLETNDNAVQELWTLWFAERGSHAATELIAAEELATMGPNHWDEAETKLWNIIESYGVHWAEPVNRLATLMYMQGRLEESRALCEVVLTVKPWHFGALSGIVMVQAGLADRVGARIWADRRLPPLGKDGDNERRREWVQRAVSDALLTLTSKSVAGESSSSSQGDAAAAAPTNWEDGEEEDGGNDFTRLRDEFDDAWQ